jgi:hypothetical protein
VWRYIFLIYGSVTVLLGIIVVLALPDSPVNAWFLSVSQCLYHTTRPSRVDEGAVFADLNSMTSGCERQHAWRRTSRARTPRNSISSIVSRLSDSPATGWYCEYIQYFISKFDHLADLAQDLRAGSIYYQRRDHQLQSAHHLWLRILAEQDYPYGTSPTSGVSCGCCPAFPLSLAQLWFMVCRLISIHAARQS